MPPVISALLALLVSLFRSRRSLHLQVLALQHQVAVYKQTVPRPRLPRLWAEWQKVLIFVQPRSVVAWQHQRFRKPPSLTWKAFLNNHVKDVAFMDFFVVPTVTYQVLFLLVILAHERRRIVHCNLTEHPTAAWTAQQGVNAFP